LQHYNAYLKERAGDAPLAEVARLPIARRPPLGLSFGQPALPATAAMMDAADVDLDPPSAFDVPAFLRQDG
jgi:hypothetical protein